MKPKIFIDGKEGTTGLQIYDRLGARNDIELLLIDEDLRKNMFERKKLINQADFVFLCLPDKAAVEAVAMVQNNHVRIIDASTAHRTNAKWAYGMPELSPANRRKIAESKRVAVPGCYASGFNAIVYPLVKNGTLAPYHPVICNAVSGYSGAGKKMIEVYNTNKDTSSEIYSPRMYALGLNHKHINEMQFISGLSYPPMFSPMVDSYYSGMLVSVPLVSRTLPKRTTAVSVWEELFNHYKDEEYIKVMPFMGEGVLEDGFLAANGIAGTDKMELFVFGNDNQILITARLDNLGKGAAGAAMQCFELMLNGTAE